MQPAVQSTKRRHSWDRTSDSQPQSSCGRAYSGAGLTPWRSMRQGSGCQWS